MQYSLVCFSFFPRIRYLDINEIRKFPNRLDLLLNTMIYLFLANNFIKTEKKCKKENNLAWELSGLYLRKRNFYGRSKLEGFV